MKKLLTILLIGIMAGCGVINLSNKDKCCEDEVKVTDNPNYIMAWNLTNKTGSLGSWATGPNGSPKAGDPALNAGAFYGYVSTGDDNWLSINGYSQPDASGGYLFNETIEIVGTAPNQKPQAQSASKCLDCLTFEYVKDTVVAGNKVHLYNVSFVEKIAPYTDGLINWTSGQSTAKTSSFTPPGSVWTSDYNFEDTLRWTSDGTSTVQNTKESGGSQYGYNYGSRAYPVNVTDAQFTTDHNAYGVGMNGVWQIDIMIGSNGGKVGTTDNLYCETFYIAERDTMYWDNKYYRDDSPEGGSRNHSHYGREIDIMETKWQPTGPQVNLPNGDSTNVKSQMSWNTDLSGKDGYNHLATTWDKMYTTFPNPTTYATFGVAILDEGLYFYGYNDKGEQVYCDGPHVMKNDTYKQTAPFVPYIGTWTDQKLGSCDGSKPGCTDPFHPGTPGGFVTSYKNFVYKTVAEMNGQNPLKDKDAFGPGLIK